MMARPKVAAPQPVAPVPGGHSPTTAAAPPARRASPVDPLDLAAVSALLVCVLLLFRLALFGGWTFVGDSDRLNTALNVRLFEVNALHERGAVPTWSDGQFMGYPIVGLHWMLPGLTPVPYVLALLPVGQIFDALDVLMAALLALALGLAYWALGVYSTGPIPRLIGALLYGLGSYTLHKLTQLDLSFTALALAPLLVILVRETRRATAPTTFLGIAACWAWLTLLTVLQEIAYIALFFGAYALYRSVRTRDPWPVVIAWLAFACGCTIGLPRILTILVDAPLLARTTENVMTTSIEALRFFGDGLLGRAQGEQDLLRGPTVNLHEGVQGLRSPLAALAVIAGGLLARSWAQRLWAVGLVVVLSVGLNPYFRSFYELEELGLRGADFPSRELRTIAANAVLLGLPIWLLSRWLARRPGPPTPLPRNRRDTPFFLGFVTLALAATLIPEARAVLYYAFLRMDFLHSRISVAMTFPLAALATLTLCRFVPARRPGPANPLRILAPWLAGGLALGLVLWVAREIAAEAVIAQIGPAVDAFRPRRLLTVEVVRVVTSLLVLGVACAILVARPRPARLAVCGGVLVALIALESVDGARFILTGPPTRIQQTPFESLNYLNAPPGALRPPSPAEREAVRARLEADRYRVVTYQDRDDFPALVEPHLAAFWGLRLVEGYSTGLPRRLAALPWTDSMYSVRHFDIHTIHPVERLPWRLLAALNVKYVITVDRSLWFNPAPGGADQPLDPLRLEIRENPYPVAPRAFFAARVSPTGDTPRLLGDDGVRPAPPDPPIVDPTRHSSAEGLPFEREFSTAGVPDATFDGDRVGVRFEPSLSDRFLVLNEMYHPSWQATVDGQPAEILPTNLVMRGIVVPAGASTVELRYAPLLFRWYSVAIMLAGAAAIGAGWWGLRRITRRP